MIESLHPGVFVAEIPFDAHPIDGVPTSTADVDARASAGRWTDHDAHDPGVTLLETLACALESSRFGSSSSPAARVMQLQGHGVVDGLSVRPGAQAAGEPALQLTPGSSVDAAGRPIGPQWPSVSSAHIRETEKHVESAFSNADRTGASLLFEEADALFGRRTEVQDAHDRQASTTSPDEPEP